MNTSVAGDRFRAGVSISKVRRSKWPALTVEAGARCRYWLVPVSTTKTTVTFTTSLLRGLIVIVIIVTRRNGFVRKNPKELP